MPTEMYIVRTSEFLRMNAVGVFDFESSRRVLMNIAEACAAKGVHYVLLDARQMQGQVNTTDMYLLAKAFVESGFKKSDRLAIVHRYGGKGAEAFAAFAGSRGMSVFAFENYEEAIEWFNVAIPVEGG